MEHMMTWEQKRKSCFDYLDRFQNTLTSFQYKSIKQTIGTLAIEDMFVSQEKIDRLIEIATGKITAEQSIEETKNRLDTVA
jgi:hypothetical protein